MKNAACGSSKEDVCAVMLRSPPASYTSLAQAFRISITSFSFVDLVGKQIAEEVHQKESKRIEQATAFLVNIKVSRSQRKNSTGEGPRELPEHTIFVARRVTMREIAIRKLAYRVRIMTS